MFAITETQEKLPGRNDLVTVYVFRCPLCGLTTKSTRESIVMGDDNDHDCRYYRAVIDGRERIVIMTGRDVVIDEALKPTEAGYNRLVRKCLALCKDDRTATAEITEAPRGKVVFRCGQKLRCEKA